MTKCIPSIPGDGLIQQSELQKVMKACMEENGMRFSLPNSRSMVHQPSGGYQGQATDILIHAQETQKLKTRLNEIYVKHTGQKLETVVDALERDNFMDPVEAKDWGLIDEIVENRSGPGEEEG